MPTPPSLWRARTQRVERSGKKSSGQTLSSKASQLLALGIGRTAKCAFLSIFLPDQRTSPEFSQAEGIAAFSSLLEGPHGRGLASVVSCGAAVVTRLVITAALLG